MTEAEKLKQREKGYKQVAALIRRYNKGALTLHKGTITDGAKSDKPQVYLYGKKEVVIGKLPKRRAYIFGTILRKTS